MGEWGLDEDVFAEAFIYPAVPVVDFWVFGKSRHFEAGSHFAVAPDFEGSTGTEEDDAPFAFDCYGIAIWPAAWRQSEGCSRWGLAFVGKVDGEEAMEEFIAFDLVGNG